MLERIFLSVPHMGGEEQALVADAFASNWLTSAGFHLEQFEREMSERLAGRHTLAVSSGTAALHLVLRAIGVGPGDRVAVSSLTFAGSVFPVLYQGATPVFIDSEDISGNIDARLLQEHFAKAARVGTLPKAVIAVHLYGQHADIDAVAAVCDAFGVILIEDAAESLGATYRGRQTATTARYAILSFNGNKIITTTGGGMVVSSDADAIARMRKWSTQAREPAVEYLHQELGYNYRMSNVLAAIGRGQLKVLDLRVQQRRAVFSRYVAALHGAPGVSFQPEAPWGTHMRWLTVMFLDHTARVNATELVQRLAASNIEARPVWRPMHLQPMFEAAECVGGEVAARLYRTGICLPSSSSLTDEQQHRVTSAILAALGG